MSVDEDRLRRAVVRIVDRGGRVVGTGFFVTRDLVATCAHVVEKALQEDGVVEIQLREGMPESVDALPTTLERESFRDEGAEDVAFLRVKPPLPEGIQPLALATSVGTEEARLRGFAFPEAGKDGLWMTATVVGPLDLPGNGRRLQLRSSNISPGCSGGPLWDERGRVVGMAVAIVDREAKTTGRHIDTAKAIAAEVLAGLCRELSIERVERSAAPFLVPFPENPGFVGREHDLERLRTLLDEHRTAGVRPAMLTGMGGIGKTQLAVAYAHRCRARHPGGVYWINAAGTDWRPAIAELAAEMRLPVEGDGERQTRLVAAFAAFVGERADALVVLDNVDDPADLAKKDRAGFVPENLGCRVLFTTRRRDAGGRFGSIEVSALPEEAALDLLLSGEKRRPLLDRVRAGMAPVDREAALAVGRALGHLPLALVLAAAYLDLHDEIPLADYRERLREDGGLRTVDEAEDAGDAEAQRRATLATRHNAAVEATLRMQWAALGSKEGRDVLRTAALLAEAAAIPRARLALLTGLGEKTVRGRPAPLKKALDELHRLSLVEELTAEDVRLHPLVREFAKKETDKPEAFAAECAARLGEALRDMGRLHEEVARRGVDAVLGDLRVGRRLAGASGRAGIEVLIRPLD